MTRKLLKMALLVPALVLSACGGGGDDGPRTPTAVPADATSSPEAWVRFVASLGADDGAEPLELNGAVPPLSETAEPIATL